MSAKLVFLKLGGSLITVKDQPHTPRLEVLKRLGREVAEARMHDKDLRILLGHGSGSFGHTAASKYKTRMGVKSLDDWVGFSEVWRQASALDYLVIAAFEGSNLPVVHFPPSASILARAGKVVTWNLSGLVSALNKGLLPVIYGDVIFDQALGGTILSTEELFSYLAPHLHPSQILLAGLEPGVWADFPRNTTLLPEITPTSLHHIEAGLKGSAGTDVTGGMLDKVRQVVKLVEQMPELKGMIFSGETPNNVRRALLGEMLGTLIHNS